MENENKPYNLQGLKKTQNLFTISKEGWWEHIYAVENVRAINEEMEKIKPGEEEDLSDAEKVLFRAIDFCWYLNNKWATEEIKERLFLLSVKTGISMKYIHKEVQIPRNSLSNLIGLDLFTGQKITRKRIDQKYAEAIRDYIYLNDKEFKIKKESYTPIVDILKIETELKASGTYGRYLN
jgi:hypothetical protein